MSTTRAATFALILFSLGIALLLVGLCPAAFALGVRSNVLDNPAIVGGAALEKHWWTWAMSSHFVIFLTFGLAVALAGLLISPRKQRVALTTLGFCCIVFVTFVAACSSGWLLFR